MDDTAKQLMKDILDAVVCEDAGTDDRFMYIWSDRWKPLRERIEEYLRQ